jgi:hypothetical protein
VANRLWAAALIVGTLMPCALLAQGVAVPAEPKTKDVCFVPRALPRCRSYPLLELSSEWGLASSRTSRSGAPAAQRDLVHLTRLNLGVARNLGAHSAIGVAATFDVGFRVWDGQGRGRIIPYTIAPDAGVELRYRRWLSAPDGALELSGGYDAERVLSHSPCPVTEIRCNGALARGGLVGVSLVAGPYMQVFARGRFLRAEGEWKNGLSAGVALTSHASYLTLAAGSVMSTLIGIFVPYT